jgi:hypothetical protein
MRSTIRHRLPARSPDVYWRGIVFATEIQEQIYRELGYESAQVLSQTGTLEEGMTRVFVFSQPLRTPGPLKRIFGDRQVLTERGSFDPNTQVFTFEVVPEGALAQRIRVRGQTRAVAVAADAIERICELECSCSIPALSSIAERFIVSSNQDIYDRRAAIERRLLLASS